MAAFDNGLAHGADGLELDVHLSRDGGVVVHHDRTLDRTTHLRGPIADRTTGELRTAARSHARRGAGTSPRRARDRRAQSEQRGSCPGGGRCRAQGERRRSRLLRIVRTACPAIRAGDRAGDRHECGARRSAMGALPIALPLAGDARRVRRISGAGACRAHARRVGALRPRRAPRRPRGTGVDRGHGRSRASLARHGEWTRSSPTGLMWSCRWWMRDRLCYAARVPRSDPERYLRCALARLPRRAADAAAAASAAGRRDRARHPRQTRKPQPDVCVQGSRWAQSHWPVDRQRAHRRDYRHDRQSRAIDRAGLRARWRAVHDRDAGGEQP